MKILTYAKLNLFLFVNDKRMDGYHNIYTGVTFINLYDEIILYPSKKNTITYTGQFAPKKQYFNDDILNKILKYLYIKNKNKFCLKIEVKKNIPYGAGLGGASADAAALLRGLRKLKVYKESINYEELSLIGSDLPMCFESKDCIVTGMGEKILNKQKFSKYYFLLIKPDFSLSTKVVYSNLLIKKNKIKNIVFGSAEDTKIYLNDLEKVAIKLNPAMKKLLKNLSLLDNVIFSQMTGSGSCCFAAFSSLNQAKRASNQIKKIYPNWWSCIAENNTIN